MEKKVFKISKRKLKKGLIVFMISFIALFIINHFGKFQNMIRLSDEAFQRKIEHFSKQQIAIANSAPGTGIAEGFYHSEFDYVITEITLNTIGGIPVSTTYDEPFLYVGYGHAHKTNNITGAREHMSYLDEMPFYILSTIYNIHCILIMMILFYGINYLYKKIEFQIN